MGIDGRLEHKLKLSDLINPESLRNLCAQFSSVHRVAVRIADQDGTWLVGSGQSFVPAKQATKIVAVESGNGTYLVARVDNQFDAIGWISLGPVKSGEKPAISADGRADGGAEILLLLCTVVEEIVFANFQSYLVSKMSLQYQAQELGELLDKDAEMQRYQDTLRESKQLNSLF